MEPKPLWTCPRCGARRNGFLANISLHRWLDSPRVVRTEDYGPNRRISYIAIATLEDLNDKLRGWLQESRDTVGMQRR